ncbi:MAG: holo-ACP synthase [bacterium]|nr:holo-ACP synthase [bacterium]
MKKEILGIGIDSVDIARIKEACEKWGEKFLQKVFTDKELLYCQKKVYRFQHLAGRFAAKEAVFKALGIGWPAICFSEIEVVNSSGPPCVRLFGKSKKIAEKKQITSILISISHTDSKAEAIAICQ